MIGIGALTKGSRKKYYMFRDGVRLKKLKSLCAAFNIFYYLGTFSLICKIIFVFCSWFKISPDSTFFSVVEAGLVFSNVGIGAFLIVYFTQSAIEIGFMRAEKKELLADQEGAWKYLRVMQTANTVSLTNFIMLCGCSIVTIVSLVHKGNVLLNTLVMICAICALAISMLVSFRLFGGVEREIGEIKAERMRIKI